MFNRNTLVRSAAVLLVAAAPADDDAAVKPTQSVRNRLTNDPRAAEDPDSVI